MAKSDGADGLRTPAPVSIRRAAAIVAMEGIVVFALGPILLVGGILMSRPDSVGRAWAGVVFALGAGVLIMFLARALSRVAGWSRSPVVVIQILAAPVGYSVAFPAQQPLYGIPILAAAATVLYLLFTPESKLAFFQR